MLFTLSLCHITASKLTIILCFQVVTASVLQVSWCFPHPTSCHYYCSCSSGCPFTILSSLTFHVTLISSSCPPYSVFFVFHPPKVTLMIENMFSPCCLIGSSLEVQSPFCHFYLYLPCS